MKHTYSRSFNQIIDSHGTPPSLVPLTIPTLTADHRMLSAANAIPSGSPFTSHTPSTPYPSPLLATTPLATSHTPQTAHLRPPKVAVSSASSSIALYAPSNLNFPNVNVVAQKGAWKSSLWHMAHVQDSDSLLEMAISRGWGHGWARMQLGQQRDQGDGSGNRTHPLFLLNSEK